MKTCSTCQNALVCHDQGECLRPTPETERLRWQLIDRYGTGTFEEVLPKLAAMESQRNKAREQLSSEKATRNAVIAKGIETERQLADARAICEELVTDSNAVTLAATVVRLERERNEAREAFALATDQLVQVQGELRQAREENAKLREALENCREDSIELLGERDWWKEEPRCGYQERYSQTAKNIQIADALLTP